MPGTFPEIDLELTASAAWGADVTTAPEDWDFTDLVCEHPSIPGQTISRLLSTPITIKRGVAVGASSRQTTTATLHLLNHDGALTPHLPTSPHYPYVDSGTPVRLQLRHQSDIVDTFTRTAETLGWGTATSGDTWIPTSGSESVFSTTGTQAQMTHAGINAIRSIRVNRPIRDVDVLFDCAIGAVQTGASTVVGPQLRRTSDGLTFLWPVVVFGLAGAVSVRVYRVVSGTVTNLGTVAVPALSYSAGTLIRCRVQADSTHIRCRAWLATDPEPSTWHQDVTDTSIPDTNNAVAVASWILAGNTNTLPTTITVDNVTISQVPSNRLEGYITDVRPAFEPESGGTTWSTVLVDVGGVGSRLEKQQAPAFSPLRRSVQLAPIPPLAYWPLEDPEGSTSGASAFPGGPKMQVTGPAVFGFGQGVPDDIYQSRYGTKPMVSVAAGASLSSSAPATTVQTEWAVSFVGQFYTPDVPAITEMRILEWTTPGGTYNRWALVGTATGYQLRAYNDAAGTVTNAATDTFGVYAAQLSYTVECFQSGGNISTRLFYNDNAFSAAVLIAGTLAAVSRVTVNPDRTNTTASVTPRGLKFIIGHVRVVEETTGADLPFYVDPVTGVTVNAGNAWYLESATSRIDRLCTEERVPCEVLGDPATTGYTQLNTQRDGTFSSLVEQAAESESGAIAFEKGFGYAVLPRTARYNQAPALTVDLSTYARSGDTDQADVLVPQLESRLANYWTVRRHLGSEGTYAAPAAFRARRGTLNEEVTIDALNDDVVDHHAAWRVHRNVDYAGAYYPAAPVDLLANPDLINDWLVCDIGSRIQRTNQPTIAGLRTIDQVIEGISETLGPKLWKAEASGAPAEVWDVPVTDQVLGKADTESSTFRAATDSAVSLLIDVLAGPRWTTDPAQMPIYVTAATGEDMQITAISGTSNPQTATVVRSLNGVVAPIPADTLFSLTRRQTAAL